MPSIAINHHAAAAGIHTDMFVQGDRPRPGVITPFGDITPLRVLEDPTCAKYFYRDYIDAITEGKYPNVHWMNTNQPFDLFKEVFAGDRGMVKYGKYTRCTMNLCIRLLCSLKLRSLNLIGVDLTPHDDYARHRNWLNSVVPVLKNTWGMTFTSLSKGNDIDCFESSA